MQRMKRRSNKELKNFKIIKYHKEELAKEIKRKLKEGIITADDYGVIDTKMAEKYGLKSSTIFRANDLINTEIAGNIRH